MWRKNIEKVILAERKGEKENEILYENRSKPNKFKQKQCLCILPSSLFNDCRSLYTDTSFPFLLNVVI
jgi:hypothetical protein